MKKNIFILLIVIGSLLGCGGEDSVRTMPSTTNNIFFINDKTGTTDLYISPVPIIVSSEEIFQTTLTNLNQTAQEIVGNPNKDKDMILSWIETLNNTNIDFEKENIIIYANLESSICKFKEISTQENETRIKIEFLITSKVCDTSLITYYWFYKVSKDIKQITIKPFNDAEVNINF